MSNPSLATHVQILLVDDDAADVRLTREALQEGKVFAEIDAVYDGEQAMAYLRREGKYSQAKRPDLILLDLNMPREDGREVLADIRADPALRHIPVVILTTSQADQDVIQTYTLGANAYVVKPVDLNQMINIVQKIEEFWFSIVKLPRR